MKPTYAPPCIVKLRINTFPGRPAYLSVEGSENTYSFLSPGSPWVTSNGGNDAIVWVLVGNVGRSTPLVGPNVPHPVLYALHPADMHALCISTPSMLHVRGKYETAPFGPCM